MSSSLGLSYEEAAEAIGISVRTLSQWKAKGFIRAFQIVPRGKVFFPVEEIERLKQVGVQTDQERRAKTRRRKA